MQDICVWKKHKEGGTGTWIDQGKVAFQFPPDCLELEVDKEKAQSAAAKYGYELHYLSATTKVGCYDTLANVI